MSKQKEPLERFAMIAVGGALVLIVGVVLILVLGLKQTRSAITPRVEQLFAAIEQGTLGETYDTDTSRDFRQSITLPQFEALGDFLRRTLGPLESLSLEGYNKSSSTENGTTIQATYSAVFRDDAGNIDVVMVREQGDWRLVFLNVRSAKIEQALVCPNCQVRRDPMAQFCPQCGTVVEEGTGTPASLPDDVSTPESVGDAQP